MIKSIDFYFELSSPYGYFASELIGDFAARYDRRVNWKPFLLGAVFKTEGTQSLVSYPMKGPYSKHDIERTARYYNIPYIWPEKFPIFTVSAARAICWVQVDHPEKVIPLSQAIYRAAFAKGLDISHQDVLAEAAESVGVGGADLLVAIKTPEVKKRLIDDVNQAMERKVFGSPFFFIDDEPFWGVDRLPQMEKWLETGGW